MLRVWQTCFSRLGISDANDSRFDNKFASQIDSHVKSCLVFSGVGSSVESILGAEITWFEVDEAVTNLKSNKGHGIDSIVAEILKCTSDHRGS